MHRLKEDDTNKEVEGDKEEVRMKNKGEKARGENKE